MATITQNRIPTIENQIVFAARRTAIQSEMRTCTDGLEYLFINIQSLFGYYGIFLELEEILRLARPFFKGIDNHIHGEFVSLKGAAALVLTATQ